MKTNSSKSKKTEKRQTRATSNGIHSLIVIKFFELDDNPYISLCLAPWGCSIALYSTGLTPYFRLKAVQKWLW